uniref:GH18 domain-containing protein n=1 Tax=Neobodo designis TaxID=312471 RepID=A0A6U4PCG1_NEODS|mmetsp:Transcript_13625/g.42371  ORF Transcript_13625/g.42371 Transcript_13625/m.42371 type:complete len:294 (+) Transcript_13625:37-918(+)
MRRAFIAALFAVVVLVSAVTAAAPKSLKPRGVMPWMCLERCGNTTYTDIVDTVATLASQSSLIAGVSFERFNLGANSTLVVNSDLTNVAPLLQPHGFTTVAMVSSYPYPPQFLDWMRQVFANPAPFMDALATAMASEGIDGVNIDWEPTAHATAADAEAYAAFLLQLRRRLGRDGRFVSVDVATWNSIWNLTAINASMSADLPGVPRGFVATMNTYALPASLFTKELHTAVTSIANASLLVGVETWPAKLGYSDVEQRFREIANTGVSHVAIWRSPLPYFWWSVVDQWYHRRL